MEFCFEGGIKGREGGKTDDHWGGKGDHWSKWAEMWRPQRLSGAKEEKRKKKRGRIKEEKRGRKKRERKEKERKGKKRVVVSISCEKKRCKSGSRRNFFWEVVDRGGLIGVVAQCRG